MLPTSKWQKHREKTMKNNKNNEEMVTSIVTANKFKENKTKCTVADACI